MGIIDRIFRYLDLDDNDALQDKEPTLSFEIKDAWDGHHISYMLVSKKQFNQDPFETLAKEVRSALNLNKMIKSIEIWKNEENENFEAQIYHFGGYITLENVFTLIPISENS